MKVINANGVDYIIHYSINSLVELEQAMGKPFTALFDSEEGVSLGSLRRIIFYGLKSKQFDMTEIKAGMLIDSMIESGSTIMDVSSLFLEELTKSLGMKQAVEPNPNE